MTLRMLPVHAAAALFACHLAACSLSAPSPHSGMHHEFTPRVLDPGDKSTRIESNVNASFHTAPLLAAGLAQGFGLKNGRQFDVLLEAGEVTIPLYDVAGDSAKPDKQDAFYLGVQMKKKFALFKNAPRGNPSHVNPSRAFSASVFGLGLGEYGNYAEYVDAYGGLSLGMDNRFLVPYFALTGGLSLPYRRKFFPSRHGSIVGNAVPTIGKYRYVASTWLLTEYGLESPFGNRDRGIRLYFSVSQGFYGMLEKDDLATDVEGIPIGFDFLYKLGLSWAY